MEDASRTRTLASLFRTKNVHKCAFSRLRFPHGRIYTRPSSGCLLGVSAAALRGARILTKSAADPFSNKPFVSFYITKRVGGGITDFNAIRTVKYV
jgi:hypothetical protein